MGLSLLTEFMTVTQVMACARIPPKHTDTEDYGYRLSNTAGHD